MKKFLLMVLLSSFCAAIHAQAPAPKKISIEGGVVDYMTREPLPGSVVSIPQLNLWVVADASGRFKFPSVTTGNYEIDVTFLGYEKLTYQITVRESVENLTLSMRQTSLTLNSVSVTATPTSSLSSSSHIDRTAMDHLQASSIADVMQLLPGNLTTNPDLTKTNQISIRDTEITPTTSFGVGVYVNGAPISNDAGLSERNIIHNTTDKERGVDMRTISTDNIASIEVIRGVASAEYGDMTSGAVIITTKAGRSPYEVRVKSDPKTKTFAQGKGLRNFRHLRKRVISQHACGFGRAKSGIDRRFSRFHGLLLGRHFDYPAVGYVDLAKWGIVSE